MRPTAGGKAGDGEHLLFAHEAGERGEGKQGDDLGSGGGGGEVGEQILVAADVLEVVQGHAAGQLHQHIVGQHHGDVHLQLVVAGDDVDGLFQGDALGLLPGGGLIAGAILDKAHGDENGGHKDDGDDHGQAGIAS